MWEACDFSVRVSNKFDILFHHFLVLLLKTQNRQGSPWLFTYRSESHSFGGLISSYELIHENSVEYWISVDVPI